MVRFKRPALEREFNSQLHPETRSAAVSFGIWSEVMGLPEPVATDICRDSNFYTRNNLAFVDSWHLYNTACDFRVEHYTPAQLEQVNAWFQGRFKKPEWELITKPHGTAPHLHLARRDYDWRASCQPGDIALPNGEDHNG